MAPPFLFIIFNFWIVIGLCGLERDLMMRIFRFLMLVDLLFYELVLNEIIRLSELNVRLIVSLNTWVVVSNLFRHLWPWCLIRLFNFKIIRLWIVIQTALRLSVSHLRTLFHVLSTRNSYCLWHIVKDSYILVKLVIRFYPCGNIWLRLRLWDERLSIFRFHPTYLWNYEKVGLNY